MMKSISAGIGAGSPRPAFWQRSGYLQTHLDFLLREISPALAQKTLQARIVEVIAETADTKSYVLKLPRRWSGFTPGMHLPVAVQINGAWMRRTYSISSTPAQFRRDRTVSITVKKVAGGLVSNWLFDYGQCGDWLQIGEAAGAFTLEQSHSDKVLLLAAGSGITPFFAMLNAQPSSQANRQIKLMYYCRRREDVIFARQLAELNTTHPHLEILTIVTSEEGRIDCRHLQRYCPDVAKRDVLMCGPSGFMAAATTALLAERVPAERILRESFGVSRDPSRVFDNQSAAVSFVRSSLKIDGDGSKTILELAEAAGLQPKFGCRGGLCHECTCTKLSGQVVDVRTGKPSRLDQEEIQVCIAVPQGTVEIVL